MPEKKHMTRVKRRGSWLTSFLEASKSHRGEGCEVAAEEKEEGILEKAQTLKAT